MDSRVKPGNDVGNRSVSIAVGLIVTNKIERVPMSIPVIQQAKIQAQVLVPLVKALQAELGEERANGLVRKALGDIYRRFGEEFWRAKNEHNLGKVVAAALTTSARDDALDHRVIGH